jgi:hypothetical protein
MTGLLVARLAIELEPDEISTKPRGRPLYPSRPRHAASEAYLPEQGTQSVLPHSVWANQEPTVFDRQIYGSPLLHLGLGRE